MGEMWKFSDIKPILDPTWERTTVLHQLMLGLVVLILGFTVPYVGEPDNLGIFFGGVTAVFVAAGAALIVPWNTLPRSLAATLPAADIVAIAMMRDGVPDSSLGLLWIFPAIWLSTHFGAVGAVTGVLASSGFFWLETAINPLTGVGVSTVLLPLVIAALSAATYLTARRRSAQGFLLYKQALRLEQALERARRQERLLTKVLDAVDFGLVRLTRRGRIAITNEAHARMQRVLDPSGAADPLSGSWSAYEQDGVTPMAPEDMPHERALRGEEFDDQVIWFGEIGADRRALSVTVRQLESEGRDDGAVLVSRDITGALELLRAREDLLASVSHELRNPLTSILGYLELVLDNEELPPGARHGIETAQRNANRLLTLVADILSASSQTEMVGLTVEPADCDLAELALASVESFQPRAAEKSLHVDTTAVGTTRVGADPLRMRQVFDNLVSNAIKYNRDGGSISVACGSDGDEAWFTIADTGIGISAAELPRMFERFYRADAVRKTSTHGSGLGLSISRDIVRSHGGDISVESRLGEGTVFTVRLPANRRSSP